MRVTTALLVVLAGGSTATVSAFTTSTSRIFISKQQHANAPLRSRFFVAPPAERSCASRATGLKMGLLWIGRAASVDDVLKHNSSVEKPRSLFAKRVSLTMRQFSKSIQRIRLAMTVLLAAVIVTFGTAPLITQPSHASTAVSTAAVRVVPSQPTVKLASTLVSPSKAKLDKMIEKYVRRNMFNDDAFDPIESAYREAHYDQTGSPYPTIISETAADILGKKEVAAKSEREGSALDKTWEKLNNFADSLEKKYGVNKQLSLSTMFIGIFCTPVIVLFLGAIAFGDRQKQKSEQMALERYGYGLNDLSAAEQIDDDIEAPDDEDDDEDEDDED